MRGLTQEQVNAAHVALIFQADHLDEPWPELDAVFEAVEHAQSVSSKANAPTRTLLHAWSTEYGECYDCGAPAAFLRGYRPSTVRLEARVCAVCAANSAADGERITRIDTQEG